MALLRTAKSCGPDAPTLASSLAEVSAGRWWQESPVTRESAEETVKTIARGMPGVSGVTVVTNARVYYPPRAATGAPSARHSLRPLIGGYRIMHHSGVSRRGNTEVCRDLSRHCERSEAIHPFFARRNGLLRGAC